MGKLIMGEKERVRAKLLEMVVQKKISLKEASIKMKVSYRQAKRIYKRYCQEGDKGLLHRGLGRPSNKMIDEDTRQKCIQLYKEKYYDFGPTLASEKLEECDGIKIKHETLRRILIKEGLWIKKRNKAVHRSRRERRECFGQMVQFDGSHHKWFENRGIKCRLMNMVDDATGTTLSFLSEEETTKDAMKLLWMWIEKYGIPQAVCCDKKNAYVLTRKANDEEILKGITPKSHFELACEKLGIEVIVANSPQSKGRVERNHKVYQDRFVKELRLANIDNIDGANKLLEKEYLPKINKKFAVEPIDKEDGHSPKASNEILKDVFCYEYSRVVSNDYVIRYENRLFQITKTDKDLPRPKNSIILREHLDGTIKLIFNNKELKFIELDKKSLKNISS